MSALLTLAEKAAATYAFTDSFEAWRHRDTPVCVPLDIAGTTLDEALASACNSCGHGDTLFVVQTHARTERQTLHCWRIRQGKRNYQRDPLTGIPGWVHPLFPDPVFSFGITEFRPDEPFVAALVPELRGRG